MSGHALILILLLACASTFPATVDAASLSTAERLIEQGNETDAIAALKQLVESSPADYQAWFLLGVTEARQRRLHDAIASFRQVISLQPTLAEPHNNLAVIYNELGDFKSAVKELEASLELKPGYVTAQENIGDLYVKLAADAYRKALVESENADLRLRYERLLRIRIKEKSQVVQADEIETGTQDQVAKKKQEKASPGQADESEIVVTSVASQQSEKKKASAVAEAGLSGQDRQEVQAAIEAWRTAWSKRDAAAYFTAYGEEYDTGSRFASLVEWKNYKRWAIKKRKFIRISLDNIVITAMAGGVIKAVFLQHFRSDSFNSDDIKEMLFRKKPDGWKIIHEVSK